MLSVGSMCTEYVYSYGSDSHTGNSDVFEDKLNLYPSESFQFLLSGNKS